MITTFILGNTATDVIAGLDTNITHIGVGTDTTTPVEADTVLGAEVDRNAEYTSTLSSNQFKSQLRLDTTDANGYTLAEIGMFNAATTGTMYTHNLISAFAKTASKKAIYINVITISVTQT
jgi:hypothetical protein